MQSKSDARTARAVAGLRALADPVRLHMVRLIRASSAGELRVGDLCQSFELSQPTISHHLRVLFEAGLVVRRHEGNVVHYRVSDAALDELVEVIEAGRGSAGLPPTSVSVERPRRGLAGLAATGLDGFLSRTSADLAYRFAGVFSPETVDRYVRESYQALYSRSGSKAHLPVLAVRFAQERLTALAQVSGGAAKPVPELLFVCTQNAGRSQMAAAMLTGLAEGRVHVRTAGSRPGTAIDPAVIEALSEIGLTVGEEFPKPLTDDVIRAADVVVTMGCGDACPIYPGKRYLDWDLPDPAGQPLDVVRDIRDRIQTKLHQILDDVGIEPGKELP